MIENTHLTFLHLHHFTQLLHVVRYEDVWLIWYVTTRLHDIGRKYKITQ